jgi:hypothetical protein
VGGEQVQERREKATASRASEADGYAGHPTRRKLLAMVDGGTLVLGDQMGRCGAADLDNWRDADPRCDF